MVRVYENLQKQATAKLPLAKDFSGLEVLVAVDGSLIFFDALVLLGTKNNNQTEREVRLVGYRANGKNYLLSATTSWALGFQRRW